MKSGNVMDSGDNIDSGDNNKIKMICKRKKPRPKSRKWACRQR